MAPPSVQAKAYPPLDGGMNKWERDYAAVLEIYQSCGEIAAWRYEPIKLRLGKDWKTTYTPDFQVILPSGNIEFHEVKGFWHEDARVKIKVAAEEYPEFRFVALTKQKGEWVEERF